MNEKEFLRLFEEKSLPVEQFNHRGHLWLAWLFIRDLGLGAAAEKLNRGIKAYAESLGATNKFHLTLTVAFACIIRSRFVSGQSFEEFLVANPDLQTAPLAIIETHYSPELLRSKEAKTHLVRPDREPFPPEYERDLEKEALFFKKILKKKAHSP